MLICGNLIIFVLVLIFTLVFSFATGWEFMDVSPCVSFPPGYLAQDVSHLLLGFN